VCRATDLGSQRAARVLLQSGCSGWRRGAARRATRGRRGRSRVSSGNVAERARCRATGTGHMGPSPVADACVGMRIEQLAGRRTPPPPPLHPSPSPQTFPHHVSCVKRSPSSRALVPWLAAADNSAGVVGGGGLCEATLDKVTVMWEGVTFGDIWCRGLSPLPRRPVREAVRNHSPDGEGAHRAPRLGAARSARAGTAGAGRRPAPSSTFTFSGVEGSAPRTLSAPRQSYFQAMAAYLGAI